MVSEKLRQLKEKSGLSVAQLSGMTGIPISTISRIMSGQTDDPGFQLVSDLILALGGSADEVAGIRPSDEEDIGPPVMNDRGDPDALIMLYNRALDEKNRTIKKLFCVCCVLVGILVIIVLYLVWDATRPDAGLIKY